MVKIDKMNSEIAQKSRYGGETTGMWHLCFLRFGCNQDLISLRLILKIAGLNGFGGFPINLATTILEKSVQNFVQVVVVVDVFVVAAVVVVARVTNPS